MIPEISSFRWGPPVILTGRGIMRNLGMYQMAVAHAAMLVRDEGQAPYVELDAPPTVQAQAARARHL